MGFGDIGTVTFHKLRSWFDGHNAHVDIPSLIRILQNGIYRATSGGTPSEFVVRDRIKRKTRGGAQSTAIGRARGLPMFDVYMFNFLFFFVSLDVARSSDI